MAGKRIKEAAPLTAAEKQKRHREKKATEKKQSEDQRLTKLRDYFISEINKLSFDELIVLMRKAYSTREPNPDHVTIKELSEMTGISVYELHKLEEKGVIKPVEDDDLSDVDLGLLGLTEDEFLRFVKFAEKPAMPIKEFSTAVNIPLHKLERLEKMGLLYAS